MPKETNPWAMYPRKTSTASLPESLKMEVITKANELIETVLKPKYIQPPPENPQFNYIVDIYGKWYHKAFYFCVEYHVGGPNPVELYACRESLRNIGKIGGRGERKEEVSAPIT